jgi:HSP20 family protein
MDISKLNPWNWFKKEEQEKPVPVQHAPTMQTGSPRDRFHSEVDKLFDTMLRGFPRWVMLRGLPEHSTGLEGVLKPHLDVSGSDNQYQISVELPGVDEKDLNIELRDDSLIIRGEKRHEHEDKGKGYYRMERSYGSFQRVLSLPDDCSKDDIKASFKQGVLKIAIPRHKTLPASARQIEISSD